MSISTEALLVIAAFLVLATLALTVVLAIRLFRTRRHLRDAGIPLQNKLVFWGALIYTISPVDLLPDPILLDDIGVLLFALNSLQGAARRASVQNPGRAPAESGSAVRSRKVSSAGTEQS